VRADAPLPTEQLLAKAGGVQWSSLYSSGVNVDDRSAEQLEALWADHVVGRRNGADLYEPHPFPPNCGAVRQAGKDGSWLTAPPFLQCSGCVGGPT
jgi:hypothetical protein